MANIKKMEMAQAIFANENISVEKTFLGLKTKLTYKPTGSPIEAKEFDFTPDMGEKMLKLLKTPAEKFDAAIANIGNIPSTPIGHFHLEVIASADGQFTAMQMFRFADFKFQKETEIVYLDAHCAEQIKSIIK